MDIRFDFDIIGVPNKVIADNIAWELSNIMLDRFDTAINLEWEDISWEDNGD